MDNIKLEIINDITEVEAEALVNVANNELWMGTSAVGVISVQW